MGRLVEASGACHHDSCVFVAVQGLSGRRLILSSAWNNPSGTYHVGIKHAYDVFPAPLKKRVQRERAKAVSKEHDKLVAEALRYVHFYFWGNTFLSLNTTGHGISMGMPACRQQTEFNATHPKPEPGSELEQKAAELAKRVSLLSSMASSVWSLADGWFVYCKRVHYTCQDVTVSLLLLVQIEDLGQVMDVVAWYEGDETGLWRAAIDTKGDGDLSSHPGFTSFRLERQWGTVTRHTNPMLALHRLYMPASVLRLQQCRRAG